MQLYTNSQLEAMTATEILAITNHIQVFTPDATETTAKWRRLRMFWHPDRNQKDPKAGDAFARLQKLYDDAMKQIGAGIWGSSNIITFEGKNKNFSFSYHRSDEIPGFGIQYTGKNNVCYLISKGNEDLVKQWGENLIRLAKVRADIKERYPAQFTAKPIVESLVDGTLVRVPKPNGFINLQHILNKRDIDAKHVTWMITRLMSMSCLMFITDTINLDICPRSVFINPITHEVYISDGWQYGTGFNKQALAAPKRTLKVSPSLRLTKIPTESTLTGQIKLLAKECFRDPIGIKLGMRKDIPKQLATWLVTPSTRTCIEEYEHWEKVKVDAFGKPTFLKYDIKESDIYN